MDIEFDSDLSDISEAEFDSSALIRPYQFEPLVNQPTTSDDDSEIDAERQSDSSFDQATVQENEPVPDVLTW